MLPVAATPRRAASATEPARFESGGSGSRGDSCVEAALTQQAICVSDFEDPTCPRFAVGRDGRTSFVRCAARG
ncbi:DUF397 domain-containing protein [Streptomyces sp. NBC_00459]